MIIWLIFAMQTNNINRVTVATGKESLGVGPDSLVSGDMHGATTRIDKEPGKTALELIR
jgi:hypothetical protein